MLVNKKVIKIKEPAKDSNQLTDVYKVIEETIEFPELKQNQIFLKILYVSVDPINRVWLVAKTYIDKVEINDVMPAFGVGQIIMSKSLKFQKGDLVTGLLQWSNYQLYSIEKANLTKIPNMYPFPHHFLGVLGINGMTAYFGLKIIGKPNIGDTVVVSTAAGATGELVCGLAKIWGCRVIGITSSQEKCLYILSVYQNFKGDKGLANYPRLIMKKAKMEGLNFIAYKDKFNDAIIEIIQYIQEGSLKFSEEILSGVENCPAALQKLFDGKNIGKILIKVGDLDIESKL